MNAKDVQKFVMRYLEATECHVTEKSPAHVTVRLSPEADKDLTNRPYYWSFVERTGAPPETMTLTFVFDPEARAAAAAGKPGAAAATPAKPQTAAQAAAASVAPKPTDGGDSILGRYFGFAPAPASTGRIAYDEVTYGSRRLEQLFGVVRQKGRYVQMFEDVKAPRGAPPAVCHTWLAVNYKIEFCCDMKRDELHSLGISLMTGEIVEEFGETLAGLPLTPRLPSNTLVARPVWSIPRAVAALEQYLERELQSYNHDWAVEAKARLDDELARVDAYYGELLPTLVEPEQREAAEAQYAARKKEIEWQYAPRIEANVVSAGIFHLGSDTPVLH
ncbi:YqhG family protein [Paenibacillus sp.]|uniref:YqhG family protein n=1 Tax=Paenibacillus sp. TaxID=58172 RepID=UPI002D6DBF27|nr:YqhG family protein [Paenibacillus sp.]HZG55543.1 YqhG family protein [Paenibacillus sp.]